MILSVLLKCVIGFIVYVFVMFSLTVAVSAGVSAGLKHYFNKKSSD